MITLLILVLYCKIKKKQQKNTKYKKVLSITCCSCRHAGTKVKDNEVSTNKVWFVWTKQWRGISLIISFWFTFRFKNEPKTCKHLYSTNRSVYEQVNEPIASGGNLPPPFHPRPGFLTTALKLLGIFWNASVAFPRNILALGSRPTNDVATETHIDAISMATLHLYSVYCAVQVFHWCIYQPHQTLSSPINSKMADGYRK